jgi:phospholipase/carboxylesterase
MFEIPPTDEPAAGAIIFLHGWGANGRDLVPLGQSLGFNNVQLVFLEGECEVPGTMGQGRGWFAIPPNEHLEQERFASRRKIISAIEEISSRGIDCSRVILLGFSQGASMSLDVMLNHEKGLGAVVALSGFLMETEKVRKMKNLHVDVPIFAAHGTHDPLLPFEPSKSSVLTLCEVGFDVEWHEYPKAHEIVQEELSAVQQFIKRVLS